MQQFKILTKAVDLFKKMNNGEDKSNIRLHKVDITNESSLNIKGQSEYTLFDFPSNFDDRTALEHIRNCAYEQLIEETV